MILGDPDALRHLQDDLVFVHNKKCRVLLMESTNAFLSRLREVFRLSCFGVAVTGTDGGCAVWVTEMSGLY